MTTRIERHLRVAGRNLWALFGIRRELHVDVRERGVFWVEGVRTRSGSRPVAWGCCETVEELSGREALARFEASRVASGRRLGATLRSPSVQHQRVDLPPATAKRAAAGIAARKLRGMIAAESDDRLGAIDLEVRRKGGHAWLATAPKELAEELAEEFAESGLPLVTIGSRHLAIANLTRLLPASPEGALTAIFDLERDVGTCVVVDNHGWLFSREVKHKFMGDRMVRSPEAQQTSTPVYDEPNALFSDADAGEPSEELDPLEREALEIERLATEIQRTIRYVETELSLGQIQRTVLCGDVDRLGNSLHALAERLGHAALDLRSVLRETLGHEIPNETGVALGALLVRDPGTQLLPEYRALRVRSGDARKRLLRLAASLLAVLVIGVGVRVGQEHGLNRKIAIAEDSWMAGAGSRRAIEEGLATRSRAEIVSRGLERLRREAPPFRGLLHTVAALLPERAEVRRLEIVQRDGGFRAVLSLRSEAPNISEAAGQVSRFIEDLRAAPFVAVDDVRQEQSSEGDSDVVSTLFMVSARLAPVAEVGHE